MRYQEIIKRKQRVIRLLWILPTLLFGFALSGWLSPIGAQVYLCGDSNPISPDPDDGIYRIRGHLTCLDKTILEIKGADAANTVFDLRGLIATGGGENTGIRIRGGADNVTIFGGTFKKCETALRVQANGCEIEHFKAINSSDKAIRIQGNGNSIVKSLCLKAGNDCFELRGIDNTAEWCTAIWHGTKGEGGQGIQFRGPGPGYAYKCSVFGGGGEGFQLQGITDDPDDPPVSGVTIKGCLAINNDQGGIEIKGGATGNFILHNKAFANYDDTNSFDLIDENDNCGSNTWKGNKFRRSNQPSCIK